MTAEAAPRTVMPARRVRLARFGLLATAFAVSACGLVYELALITLGAYLVGNTAKQASIVLAVMVFAMGLGALAAKPLRRWPALAFAAVELALALLGGFSVMLLYAAFSWTDLYSLPLVLVAAAIGLLIGAEIPLLMELLQRIREQAAGAAVADLNAADYLGGLIGGLAFPFILLPFFGQIQGALLVGAVNAVAGVLLVWILFRHDLAKAAKQLLTVVAALTAVLLVAAFAYTGKFETAARQALYAAPIVYSEDSQYQQIVMTEAASPFGEQDLRLYLNGDLQFSSVDEYRYHEALVHPAMNGPHENVLVLGGGDGLAVREILRYPDVATVTLVDLDGAVTDLAREFDDLVALNENAMNDPKVEVVNADAFTWLREQHGTWDTIIVDMPDPDATETAKLYSVEFYGLATDHLAEAGRMVVQAGSPYFAPKTFWTIASTLEAAGHAPAPYWVSVPSFGDWGYMLVQAGGDVPDLGLDTSIGPFQSLTPELIEAAQVFPPDRDRMDMEPSTLMRPVILDRVESEWNNY
ncbi:spermidine synthase [Glycomyces algeriensis]|uniref:Polyamine aminopropyltransferase n=2 Tax=Glycomyces algeriensis TaxID=256037 RepID=A0A9W6G923_9ACTN|nr:polyamine aminopropyltransferase [Glycomyces algeriensis]MDA1365122.1 polyamine aminopropyltransferase [Glycomyces algeriensis]MDR7349816.1 spermidine synthase [Glycomyces algeriensis]GLI42527.1 polyamine aminopropyltransferase 1 [Glycomyces algeriensis]